MVCGPTLTTTVVIHATEEKKSRLIMPDGRSGRRRGLSTNQTLRETHVHRNNDRTNQSVLNIKLTNIPTASRLWFLADLRHKKCMYIGINYYVQTPTSGAKPCHAPTRAQPAAEAPTPASLAGPRCGQSGDRLSSRGTMKNKRKLIRIINHLTN